jgi:hypothetical protein
MSLLRVDMVQYLMPEGSRAIPLGRVVLLGITGPGSTCGAITGLHVARASSLCHYTAQRVEQQPFNPVSNKEITF